MVRGAREPFGKRAKRFCRTFACIWSFYPDLSE